MPYHFPGTDEYGAYPDPPCSPGEVLGLPVTQPPAELPYLVTVPQTWEIRYSIPGTSVWRPFVYGDHPVYPQTVEFTFSLRDSPHRRTGHVLSTHVQLGHVHVYGSLDTEPVALGTSAQLLASWPAPRWVAVLSMCERRLRGHALSSDFASVAQTLSAVTDDVSLADPALDPPVPDASPLDEATQRLAAQMQTTAAYGQDAVIPDAPTVPIPAIRPDTPDPRMGQADPRLDQRLTALDSRASDDTDPRLESDPALAAALKHKIFDVLSGHKLPGRGNLRVIRDSDREYYPADVPLASTLPPPWLVNLYRDVTRYMQAAFDPGPVVFSPQPIARVDLVEWPGKYRANPVDSADDQSGPVENTILWGGRLRD